MAPKITMSRLSTVASTGRLIVKEDKLLMEIID
ncbi:MAG: hypothetical protein BWY72_02417 [Bacteroidetes bacterium ADurb.Bin416]|nr:MAG: hypothetical protein BWY72_02417 [Bacteroidetes bacterium ADurb.Bin416]